jgi:hypothetical protein
MSQARCLEMAYKGWAKRVHKAYEEVCAEVIRKQAMRRSEGEDDEGEDKEVAKAIAKIMETLVGNVEYRVKVNKSEDPATCVDREYLKLISNQKTLKRIYKSFAFAVNTLLTFTESYKLQSTCLRLLERFYGLIE